MDLQGLTSNQDYLALPQTERAKVVEHIAGKNPDFQSLPDTEKVKVLNHLVQYKEQPKTPAAQKPAQEGLGKNIVGSAAVLADQAAGLIVGGAQAAGQAFSYLKGKVTGEPQSAQKAVSSVEPLNQLQGGYSALIDTAFGAGTSEGSSVGHFFGQIGKRIQEGQDKYSKGDPEKQATAKVATDFAMNYMLPHVLGIAGKAVGALKGAKVEAPAIDHADLKAKLNQLSPDMPKEQVDHVVKTVEKSLPEIDKHINAETKAHDLMARGASKKEVEAVIRKNPLVGTKLEEIRQRRADQKAAMQHTVQGEVLPPEQGGAVSKGPEPTPPTQPPAPKQLGATEEIQAAPAPKEEAPIVAPDTYSTLKDKTPVVYTHTTTPEGHIVTAEHADTGEKLGQATFRPHETIPGAHEAVVKTEEPWQRKGVATGMYKHAQEAMGLKVEPSAIQTEAGKAFTKGRQTGKADPELLAAIGLTAGGALTGYLLSDKDRPAGALLGALAGFTGARAITKMPEAISTIGENWKASLGKTAIAGGAIGTGAYIDQEDRIEGALFGAAFALSRNLPKAKKLSEEDLIVGYHDGLQAHNRIVGNVVNAVKEYIPDEGARKAFYEKMHRKDFANMTPGEREVAKTWKQLQVQYGEMAKEAGVIKGFIEDYVPRIASKAGMDQTEVQKLLAEIAPERTNVSGSTKSKHGKSRTQDSFDDFLQAAKAKGLEVDNVDFADVMGDYLRSMNKAVQAAKLIKTLEESKLPSGADADFIVPAERAPADYKTVSNPQMIGKRVHPELADAMNIVMGGHNHHEVVNGALAITSAAKRINVISSFFHAQSLVQAAALAGKNPFDRLGITKALNDFKTGVVGDEIDKGIKSGLMVGHPDDAPVGAIGKLGELVDVMANKALGTNIKATGKAFTAVEAAQMAVFDRVTWDYLHTGLKLSTYLKEMEAYRAGTKYKGMNEDDVRKGIASGVNDTFGGLNWARVHQEAQTVVGRKITSLISSPNGRDMMGLLMFAPDWTASALRAFSKGLPGGTANKANATFARRYVRNTIAAYLVGLNAINMATSGVPIWDNKDPTKIKLPDGEVMQLMKHAMEPYEAVLHPTKFITNKLGAPIKVSGVLLTKSPSFNPNFPVESRVGAIAGLISPFSVNPSFDPNVTKQEALIRGAAGALGVGIYGTSNAMKQTEEYKKRQRDRYARMHGNKPSTYNPTR